MTQFNNEPATYLRVAAQWGLYIGAAAAVAVLSSLLSIGRPLLLLPAIAGYVAVPVILWKALSWIMNVTDGTAPFSHLWRTGTLAMTAGGLLLGFIAFIVFKWLDPDFIERMFNDVIQMYEALDTSQADSQLATLRAAREAGLPGAADMALQLFTFTVLSGSVLSLIITALLRHRAAQFRSTPPSF